MRIKIMIKRQENSAAAPYWQTFLYEGDGEITVADYLRVLNEQPERMTIDGKTAKPVIWACSCMEQKCGACAMVISGRPGLACAVFLKDAVKHGKITLSPLSKFPVVRDLQVDRESMFTMLKEMRIWVDEKDWSAFGTDRKAQFQAGQCLMCGCCLEACPNYRPQGWFGGAAALANAYKAVEFNMENEHAGEMKEKYRQYFLKGCGQSLSCRKVCPVNVPLDLIQARMNKKSLRR